MFKNCVVYWCDTHGQEIKEQRFRHQITSVLGDPAQASPSESLMLFPTWEAFEQASA